MSFFKKAVSFAVGLAVASTTMLSAMQSPQQSTVAPVIAATMAPNTNAQKRDSDKDYATVLNVLTTGGEKDFHGFNLQNKTFLNLDLSKADLSDADLSGAKLEGVNLNGANLTNTLFIGAELKGPCLTDPINLPAQLCLSPKMTIISAILNNTNFSRAQFLNVKIAGHSTLDIVNFSNATIKDSIFETINGKRLNFSNATIELCMFHNCSITESSFNDANIITSNFCGKAGIFINSNLTKAHLINASIQDTIIFDPPTSRPTNPHRVSDSYKVYLNTTTINTPTPTAPLNAQTNSSTIASTTTNNSSNNTQTINTNLNTKATSPIASATTAHATSTPLSPTPIPPIVTTTCSSNGITTSVSAPSTQTPQTTEIKPPSKNVSAQTASTQAANEKQQPAYFPCTLPEGKMPWISTTGLENPGVACYASSVMQCLSAIDPLMINLTKMETKHPVVAGFKQLINAKIAQSATDTQTGKTTAAHKYPADLYNNINLHFFRGNGLLPQPPQQQDAQEFYVKLIVALGDIGNLFHNATVSSVTCSVCQCERITDEKMSINQKESNPSCISLAIPSDVGSTSLSTLLDNYYKTETLEDKDETEQGKNAYKCPHCKERRKASKRLLLDQLPDVLTIHLSRFDAQRANFKNLAPVSFPLGLTIKNEYLTHPTTTPVGYTLVGVVIHHGLSRHGGHYIAVTKNAGNQTWYECNDDKITRPQQEAITQFASLGYWQGDFLKEPATSFEQRFTYTPTLLFYVRNDVMAKYGNTVAEAIPETKPAISLEQLTQAINSLILNTMQTQSTQPSDVVNLTMDQLIALHMNMQLMDAIQTGNIVNVKTLLAGVNNDIYANNHILVDSIVQTHQALQAKLLNLQAIFKLLPPAVAPQSTPIDKKVWDELLAAITAADSNRVKQLIPTFNSRRSSIDGKTTIESHFTEVYHSTKNQLLNMDQITQIFLSLA